MTNERAVEILNLDLDILGQYGGETAEAYKMAIKALEQLQDVHDTCKNCIEFSEFKQQPSEDCISRQKAESEDK